MLYKVNLIRVVDTVCIMFTCVVLLSPLQAYSHDNNGGNGQGNAYAYGHDKSKDKDKDKDKDNNGKQGELDERWNKDTWTEEDERDWNNSFRGNEHGGKGHGHRRRSIDLVQVQHMDFGMLPSGGKRCVLKSNQNLVGDCVGNGVLGEIEVKGVPFYAYEVVVRELGWKQGRRLVPKLKAQDYYLDARGKDIIYVRGAISFMPGKVQRPGAAVLTYIISVFYQ